MQSKKRLNLFLVYSLLTILSVVWLFPIAWVVLTSFRREGTAYVSYLIPQVFTLDNYTRLFSNPSFPFAQWFTNTLIVATATALISTFITVAISYALSRLTFKYRNGYLKLALVLNMFPAFMSMIAIYYILKAFGLTQTLFALILVYSAGAALNFYIVKGFFDTIPYSLDESAMIDGATRKDIFFRITLPLSRPIIVYTALTAFIGPWIDFIFARVILGDATSKYTVAIGLFSMLEPDTINSWFKSFAAGAVLIAIPITLLFIVMQRFYVEGVTGGSVK